MNASPDICDVPLINTGCDIVDGPSGWFESWVTSAADGVFGFAMAVLSWIWDLIRGTTTPHTAESFVTDWASRVFGIALPITVGLMVIQVITLVLRNRSGSGLGTAVVRGGAAVLVTFLSVPVIHLLTTGVDGVADDLTAITFGDINELGERFTELLTNVVGRAGALPGDDGANYGVLGGGSVVAGAFGLIVFGTFLVMGALAVFAALLIRTMLLDIAVVLGPLAIMGLAWERTSGWVKKWAALVLALVFTKLAVMIVFGLGVSGLESLSFTSDGAGIVGVLMTSTLMLLLAAVVPVACFKFMSFVGDEVEAGALHGAGSAAAARGKEGMARANPMQIMRSRFGGGNGSSESASSSSQGGSGDRSTPSPTTRPGSDGGPAGGGAPQSGAGPSGGTAPGGAGSGGGAIPGTAGGNARAAGAGSPTCGPGTGAKAPTGAGASTPSAGAPAGPSTGAASGVAGGAPGAAGVAAGAGVVVAAAAKTAQAGAAAASRAASESDEVMTERGGPDLTRPGT